MIKVKEKDEKRNDVQNGDWTFRDKNGNVILIIRDGKIVFSV
jgi:hypothetical protein